MFAGLLANYYLLVNTAIRPVLWTTTNTFIAAILVSNILYLNVQAVLENEDEMITTHENGFYQYLDKKFAEEQKTPACSVRFVSQFIHESVLLSIQLGIVFIRSMMVKHGDNIRTRNCKVYQARLRDAVKKKYYLDSEIVPISSDTPTIGPVSEHLDSEYWSIFLTPLPNNVIGK